MNLDAGQPARNIAEKTGWPAQTALPQPVITAMQDDRMDTGIARQDVENAARRRVPFKHTGYVFFE